MSDLILTPSSIDIVYPTAEVPEPQKLAITAHGGVKPYRFETRVGTNLVVGEVTTDGDTAVVPVAPRPGPGGRELLHVKVIDAADNTAEARISVMGRWR